MIPTGLIMCANRGDHHWGKVVLALPMDGPNGSTNIVDLKGHPITANGNAQISTAQSKYGGAALYCDGISDSLATPSAADQDLSVGDWTIVAWVYVAAVPTENKVIMTHRVVDNLKGQYSLQATWKDAANHSVLSLLCSMGGTTWDLVDNDIDNGTLAVGTWQHVAATRQGDSFRIFLDGVLKSTTIMTGNLMTQPSEPITIGGTPGGARSWCGWIDDVRITRGIARYTANFTPPGAI